MRPEAGAGFIRFISNQNSLIQEPNMLVEVVPDSQVRFHGMFSRRSVRKIEENMNLPTILRKITFFALPCLLLYLSACNPSNDDPANGNNGTSLTQPDGWKITYYWDKDKEETGNFSGYTFFFETDGTLTAVRNNATETGTWSTGTSDGFQRLNLQFGPGVQPLDDLSDDWIQVLMTDTRIELKDDNDTHLEEVVFERL